MTVGLGVLAGPVAVAQDPVRILLLGDSVTQGSAGDWTWRYRLWRHFKTQGVAVDFVGPRADLWDYVHGQPGSFDYINPVFDSDHAARWGMSFTDQDYAIDQLVLDYDADVVVEMLGINDLVWQGATPEEVHDRASELVLRARSSNPEVDVVVARVAQHWVDRAPESNARLSDIPAELGTAESAVAVATTDVGFKSRPHTYDTVHPSASGEIRIAAAVADALATLGVGSPYPRPLPVVPLGPRLVPVVTARPGDRQAHLAWEGSPGSDHEFIWRRDITAGLSWGRRSPAQPGNSFTVGGLRNGHTYAFKLQPAKGHHAAAPDIRSNVVRVTPRVRPGAVSRLLIRSAHQALRADWVAARNATAYSVRWWPTGHRADARVRRVTETRARLGGLVAGGTYRVIVTSLNRGVRGPKRAATGVAGPRVRVAFSVGHRTTR